MRQKSERLEEDNETDSERGTVSSLADYYSTHVEDTANIPSMSRIM